MSETRSITRNLVGGREAYLCDGLYDEVTVSRVADLLSTLRFRRVERSRTGSEVSGGSAEIPANIAQSEPLFCQLISLAEEAFAARGLVAQRLYVNSTVFGDMYYPHRDFNENEKHLTVLYYANPVWNADWGGETILYDDDGDARMVVSPRPGRVLAFRGAILHRGGVPTRACFEERLTVAYKLRIPESGNSSDRVAADSADAPAKSPGLNSLAEAVATVTTALSANDVVRASRISEQCLAAGLTHPAFYNACALQAEREGNDEKALLQFEQARLLAPRNTHILDAIGLCLTRLARFKEAAYAFEQSIRIAPANASPHHLLGLALGKDGNWDLAERAHVRAAQLDPRNADAFANLALIAARRGDLKSAQSQADRALKLDPSNATALAALDILSTRRTSP